MNTQVKPTSLRWRLLNFADRILNRLQFFPLTPLFIIISGVARAIQLRLGHGPVRVGGVTNVDESLPRNVMLWLGRTLASPLGQQFDVCLRLPRDATSHRLHDVFSVLLAFPGSRSIYLYWDSSSLADDLPLLQAKLDPDDPAVSALPYHDLGPPGITQFEAFLRPGRAEIALPVAAMREAQNLLKRLAGGTYAVCLNVPAALHPLADTVARSRPDVRFFDLSPAPPRTGAPENIHSLLQFGLTLHERMALAQSVDAYVGSFDELGCAAVMSARTAVLFGGGIGGAPARIDWGDAAVWYPIPEDPMALTEAVVQCLSRRLASEDKDWGNAQLPERPVAGRDAQ